MLYGIDDVKRDRMLRRKMLFTKTVLRFKKDIISVTKGFKLMIHSFFKYPVEKGE